MGFGQCSSLLIWPLVHNLVPWMARRPAGVGDANKTFVTVKNLESSLRSRSPLHRHRVSLQKSSILQAREPYREQFHANRIRIEPGSHRVLFLNYPLSSRRNLLRLKPICTQDKRRATCRTVHENLSFMRFLKSRVSNSNPRQIERTSSGRLSVAPTST
jgi:hypothetical protein